MRQSVTLLFEGFSYALDDNGPLAVQLVGIASVRLLLAVLQAGAGVGLEHSVLGAEVAGAEATVADDALGGFLALLEVATGLARRHVGETLEISA